ncbi:HAMP domain-containing histidine kinase, partial [Vibrio cholerae]|nr:HAMP domain-containing histidine kinase [Vibrio cholerae]
LIESEKLAALGGLVAGVAHEVNTPLGIAVTASSVIIETTKELNDAFANQTLTSQQFSELMQRLNDTNTMLENNLNRAAKLIRDFKQTAVDQVSESRSQFSIYQVLSALIASLHPETRKIPVVPKLEGDERLMMNSLPGVLTQIVSNLVMNSINHAFSNTPNPT